MAQIKESAKAPPLDAFAAFGEALQNGLVMLSSSAESKRGVARAMKRASSQAASAHSASGEVQVTVRHVPDGRKCGGCAQKDSSPCPVFAHLFSQVAVPTGREGEDARTCLFLLWEGLQRAQET